MDEHRLDCLVAPTSAPASLIDLVNGSYGPGGSSSFPAIAGYPDVTVPAGWSFGLPVGLSFFGRAGSEPTLFKIAYAFEQATQGPQAAEVPGDGGPDAAGVRQDAGGRPLSSGNDSGLARRARRCSASSMFRPVTTRTTGPGESPSCGSAARAEAAAPSARIPGSGVRADAFRDRAFRDEEHAVHDALDQPHGLRDRHANREAVGESGHAIAIHHAPGVEGERHHRSFLGRDAHDLGLGCARLERPANARDQRPVSDRNDDGGGR